MWNSRDIVGVCIFVYRTMLVTACVLLYCAVSPAQQSSQIPAKQLPCEFKGDILESAGKPLWLTSKEMKKRAVKRVDVGALAKNADIKAVVIASVLVDHAGSVHCLKIVDPVNSLVDAPTVEALEQWKFKPMKQKGKHVAYVGWLQFEFCRIGCPEGKNSVTLLE